jgi:site-specific DNA-methyltransferase (adenine-specific)
LQILKPTLSPFAEFNGSIEGSIYNADVLNFLANVPDRAASIIFLDPPFNLGKAYSAQDSKLDLRPEDEYLTWLIEVIKESSRCLSPGGALYLYHMPSIAVQITSILNNLLQFRHWIAVSMKNGFARGKKLYPAHYALLYYTNGIPRQFCRPRILPRKCRNCNEYVKDYGGYKKIIEEKGINLSDVWDDISPVRHRSKKNRVQNELPEEFMRRIIEISGIESELYMDPFAGAGSGIIAAIDGGMKFLGCDIVEDYCNVINVRIKRMIECTNS